MLKAYLPALVFLILGLGLGTALTRLNRVLGPRRPTQIKREPYECGLPSDVRRGFRFGISFYLVGMLFILFDIEVILLYPVAVLLAESGVHALGAIAVFLFFLAVAFVYEWRRGSLDWM
jgi:NADH-quinone oxidoreductase subunit A